MASKRKTKAESGTARKTGTRSKAVPVAPPAAGKEETNGHVEGGRDLGSLDHVPRLNLNRDGKPAEDPPPRSDLNGQVAADPPTAARPGPSGAAATVAGGTLPVRRCMTMDRVTPTEVEWILKPWLPRGQLVLLVGEPEGGKSTLLARIAGQESGGPTVEGERTRPPGSVMMFSPEQDLGGDTRRKLDAAGAILNRVHAGDMGDDGKPLPRLTLPSGMDKLRQRVKESRISCILFDPVSSYLDDGFDPMNTGHVRFLLDQLIKLAAEEDCLIVCTLHYRKSREGNAMDWVAGSAAWVQVPRVVIGLGRDPDTPERRVMTTVKNNLVPEKPSRLFELVDVDGVARFNLGGVSSRTAQDLGAGAAAPDERDALADATAWLKDEVQGEKVPTKELQRRAEDAGHSWRTVKRAKKLLGVVAVKVSNTTPASWAWQRPGEWPE